MVQEYDYNQIIEYIDETWDENFNAAKNWANEHNTSFKEDLEKRELPKRYFVIGPEPQPYIPTKEEIRQMRIQYRRNHIDDQTAERSRKIANGTWTDEDEQTYLALDAEVTAYIEEHYPYPVEIVENVGEIG